MGVIQGRCSFTSYHVTDLKRPLTLAQIDAGLHAYAAKDIKIQGGTKPLTYGWVPAKIAEVEGSDEWSVSNAHSNGGVLLRARIDKRQVPTALIQLCLKQRLTSMTKRNQKPLGRKERRELLDEIKTELLAQALPQISYVDAYWNNEQTQFYVFATSKQARLVMEDLFAKSFGREHGAKLVHLASPLMGLNPDKWHDMDDAFMQRLSLTVPMPIVEHRA